MRKKNSHEGGSACCYLKQSRERREIKSVYWKSMATLNETKRKSFSTKRAFCRPVVGDINNSKICGFPDQDERCNNKTM